MAETATTKRNPPTPTTADDGASRNGKASASGHRSRGNAADIPITTRRRVVAEVADDLIARADAPGAPRSSWTFLTNHGHVLIYIARNPEARVRDIAADVGITERSAHSILRDLARSGYITPEKRGRRNAYRLHSDLAFRHPAEADRSVGELLRIFVSGTPRKRRTSRASA